MAVSYNEGNLAYMRELAKEQGISLAELTRRRRLDEEFGSSMIAQQSTFEPVFTESITEAAQHQNTSHIGAEEREVGSTVGSAAGAILGGIVGGPAGASIGAAAGKAIGGGGSMTDAATGAIGSATSKYPNDLATRKPGDPSPKDEMKTRIKGVFN